MPEKLTILTLIGARPQFIKAAPVSRAIKKAGLNEIIVHSGQHFDFRMSQLFFEEMGIPEPDINLEVGSGLHGQQTGLIMERFEQALLKEKPDLVLVHGDTNSTLAGALTSAKLRMPIAHNEAGLRSFNRTMPEEHNRVLSDHCSDLLFCPVPKAVAQLRKEGITKGVHLIGDVMYDLTVQNLIERRRSSEILRKLNVYRQKYLLLTLHRPYNVDSKSRMTNLLDILGEVKESIILPLHPRTGKRITKFSLSVPDNLKLVEPLGYFDMATLEASARMILTDSGGVQKEAYFHGVPCVTLRPETEWTDTVEAGWNRVVGLDRKKILAALSEKWWAVDRPLLFGEGNASEKLVAIIKDYLDNKKAHPTEAYLIS